MEAREIAKLIINTANREQIPMEEVVELITDNITELINEYCYHYTLKPVEQTKDYQHAKELEKLFNK